MPQQLLWELWLHRWKGEGDTRGLGVAKRMHDVAAGTVVHTSWVEAGRLSMLAVAGTVRVSRAQQNFCGDHNGSVRLPSLMACWT